MMGKCSRYSIESLHGEIGVLNVNQLFILDTLNLCKGTKNILSE